MHLLAALLAAAGRDEGRTGRRIFTRDRIRVPV